MSWVSVLGCGTWFFPIEEQLCCTLYRALSLQLSSCARMMIMRPQAFFDPCWSGAWEPVMCWDDGRGQAGCPGCNWRTPQAWVTHTAEGIVMSVNVHEP